MKMCNKGSDYFGYFCCFMVGKRSGLYFRVNTSELDLMLGISINWKDEKWISIRLFNFEATYYSKVEW